MEHVLESVSLTCPLKWNIERDGDRRILQKIHKKIDERVQHSHLLLHILFAIRDCKLIADMKMQVDLASVPFSSGRNVSLLIILYPCMFN